MHPGFEVSPIPSCISLFVVASGKHSQLFSYSTQLSTKFILLINVKMPTIIVKMPTVVGMLTFISMINTKSENVKQKTSLSVF